MSFNDIISKIVSEEKRGSQEPFFVVHDNSGWHIEFPDGHSNEAAWKQEITERDPLATQYRGADFEGSGKASAYNKVLRDRLRMEYFEQRDGCCSDSDRERLTALISFFEENITELSPRVTDYLAEFDRPFRALDDMRLFSFEAIREGGTFDEDWALETICAIENIVADRLSRPKDEPAQDTKRNIEGYEETFCLRLGGKEIVVAENPSAEMPYLLCDISDHNPFGLEERTNGIVSDDYVEIMREFVNRVDAVVEELEADQRQFGLPVQIMTAADCLPDSNGMDWKGKAVIVKADTLAPEYRSAQHQIYLCTGGFGAAANARGQKVYVKSLDDGKECHFQRYQIAGVADPAKLPDWAKDKLGELTQSMPEKKPSLLGRLDASKRRARQNKSSRKGNPSHKKSNDLEV
ncbi:hypothetical protein LJC63_01130 [Ruminococcaceae bacterium OttesenSCG-928-L11]|nr:hypothetical protein [Ruminococcaceae bacterium OttesenSCG-928-L11]